MTDTTAKNACSALQLAGGWECERCALAWDAADTTPACEPVTFTRLRNAALDEAERIEQSQRALTSDAGGMPPLRKLRYQPQLKRAMELRALARMVDKAKEKAA
jgi:hypothetical protein